MKSANTNKAAVIPSAEYLATLAATMGKRPKDALDMWLDAVALIQSISNTPPGKRSDYIRDGRIFYTLKEAMQELGVISEDTFFGILRFHRLRGPGSDEGRKVEDYAHEANRIREHEKNGLFPIIDDDLLGELLCAKRDKRAETARANKVSASKKRRRVKRVK